MKLTLKSSLIALLYLHLVVNLIHAAAHTYFGVVLAPIHGLFAVVFFFGLPIASLVYLLTGKMKQGVIMTILFSIPTSIYAFLYHFVLNTYDFVCLFGAVTHGKWFTYSAYAISILLLILLFTSIKSAYEIGRNENIATILSDIERNGKLPMGTEERFNGYSLTGVTFDSGHILALRRIPHSSVGGSYTSVWHRTPYGYWTFYSDALPALSCTRFFGKGIDQSIVTPISIKVSGKNRITVHIEEYRLKWEFTVTETLKTKLMNTISLFIPNALWKNSVFLVLLAKIAGWVFNLGTINLDGHSPNGHYFIANPYRLWQVKETNATINGMSLGNVKELSAQAALGDFKITQQPLFALVNAYYKNGAIIIPESESIEFDC